MSVPTTPSAVNSQFSLGSQSNRPSLLSRITFADSIVPSNPVIDSDPSSPPASPKIAVRTSSLGRLAVLVSPGNRSTALPEAAAPVVPRISESSSTAASSSAPVPSTALFNVPPEIFKVPASTPSASAPAATSLPTSFYFRGGLDTEPSSAIPAGPSAVPPASAIVPSASQPSLAAATTIMKHTSSASADNMQIDAPSRPPEPVQSSRASVPSTSPAAVPSESIRLFEALRDNRIDLDDVRRTRERARDEFQEFRHRCRETEHALERQKAQMERLVAVCEEWFDKEEHIHERREQRLAGDQARLAALQDEERVREREAELARAGEQARAEAEESRRHEEEQAKAQEQARVEAEEKKRQEEERARIEEQARVKAEERKKHEEAERQAEAAERARLAHLKVEEEKRKADEEAKAKAEQARLEAEEKKRKEEQAKARAAEQARLEAEEQRKAEEARAKAQEQVRLAAEKKRQEEERIRLQVEEQKRLEFEVHTKAAREALERQKREAEAKVREKEMQERAERETARVTAEPPTIPQIVAVPMHTQSTAHGIPAPSPEVAAALAAVTPLRELPMIFGSPLARTLSPRSSAPDALQSSSSLLYPQDDMRTQVTEAPYLQVRRSLQNGSGPTVPVPSTIGSASNELHTSGNAVDIHAEAAAHASKQEQLKAKFLEKKTQSPDSSGAPSLPAPVPATPTPSPAGLPAAAQKPPSMGHSGIVRNRYPPLLALSSGERKPVPPQRVEAVPAQASSAPVVPKPTPPRTSLTPASTKGGKKKKSDIAVKPEPNLSPTILAVPVLSASAAPQLQPEPPCPVAPVTQTQPPAPTRAQAAHVLPPKPVAPAAQPRGKDKPADRLQEQPRTKATGDRSARRPPSPTDHSNPASQAPRNTFTGANQPAVPQLARAVADRGIRPEPLADKLNRVPTDGGFYDDGMVASMRSPEPPQSRLPYHGQYELSHSPPPHYDQYGASRSPSPYHGQHDSPRGLTPPEFKGRIDHYSPAPAPHARYTLHSPPISPGRKRLRDDNDRELPPARRFRYEDDPNISAWQRSLTPPPRRAPLPRATPPSRTQAASYRLSSRDVRRSPPLPRAHQLADQPPSYAAVSSNVSRETRRPGPRADEPRRPIASSSRTAGSQRPVTPPPSLPDATTPLISRLSNAAPVHAPQDRSNNKPALLLRMSDAPPRSTVPHTKPGKAAAEEPPRRGKAPNRSQAPKGPKPILPQGKGSLESRFS